MEQARQKREAIINTLIDQLSIFLSACGVALLSTFYVVWPLFQKARPIAPADDDPVMLLLQRKNRALLSIKELEFDYNTGKLTDSDYADMNGRLRHQAIVLLQQIEKTVPNVVQLEEQIEAEILGLRQITD